MPIRIAIIGPDGEGSRMHLMERPFAIVGRSPDCDIHLDDERVSYRHAYLQRIGGRILCVDLCSRTGILLIR